MSTGKLLVPNTISTFIQSQFPRLYDDNGQALQSLLTAYYEWMELSANSGYGSATVGNPTNLARNLFNIRDIDTTTDTYFKDFQSNYLYGVPETITGDKKFLIKHIVDVYRAKGNIEGYTLLFKLFYNADVNIYLPKDDIFKTSDNTWNVPYYVELSDSTQTLNMINQPVVGSYSGATAIVDIFVTIAYNGKINNLMYLKNIVGNFVTGEFVYLQGVTDSTTITTYPTIIGSVSNLTIVSNANVFKVGDYIKASSGSGTKATFRVSGTTLSTQISNVNLGSINFVLVNSGTYYSNNAYFIYSRNIYNKDTNISSVKLLLQPSNTQLGVVDASLYENKVSNTNSNTIIATSSPLKNSNVALYLYTNSSNFYANATNANYTLTGDFTVETYFYLNSLYSSQTILTSPTGSDYIKITNTGSSIGLSINSIVYNVNLLSTLSLNTWYHLAISRNSNTIRVFINGTLQGSIADSNNFFNSSSTIYIGSNNSITSNSFIGYLSNFRITNATRYTSSFTPDNYLSQNNTPIFSGTGANISISSITSKSTLNLNTDYINDLNPLATINGSITGFSNTLTVANSSSTLSSILSFKSDSYGIPSFTLNSTGYNYIYTPDLNVRDLYFISNNNSVNSYFTGNVTFTNTNIRVTGIGTNFSKIATNYLALISNTKISNSNTDIRIIRLIANDTLMYLDDYPAFNSDTSSNNSTYSPAFPVIQGNYAYNKLLDLNANQGGNNLVISLSSSGTSANTSELSSIASLDLVDSGYGYQPGELVSFAKINYLTGITVLTGGTDYSTGDILNIYGGNPSRLATATVVANSTGSVVSVNITDPGSNYQTIPYAQVFNSAGKDATFQPVLSGLSLVDNISGYIIKSGLGKHQGDWINTKSFTSSDKYIQDSYYYQTYSYELQTSLPFSTYSDTVKKTFHPTGINLFGKAVFNDNQSSISSVSNNYVILS